MARGEPMVGYVRDLGRAVARVVLSEHGEGLHAGRRALHVRIVHHDRICAVVVVVVRSRESEVNHYTSQVRGAPNTSAGLMYSRMEGPRWSS